MHNKNTKIELKRVEYQIVIIRLFKDIIRQQKKKKKNHRFQEQPDKNLWESSSFL